VSPFVFLIVPICGWTLLSIMGSERQRLKSEAEARIAGSDALETEPADPTDPAKPDHSQQGKPAAAHRAAAPAATTTAGKSANPARSPAPAPAKAPTKQPAPPKPVAGR